MELLAGSLGALIMVLFGFAAILSVPICVSAAVFGVVTRKKLSDRFIMWCCIVPVICLGGAIGMFIIRAVLATFFAVGEPLD